jgi:1,4-alpha-glucan branching enzyme
MIAKQNTYATKNNNKVLITFVMPAIDNCACLYLVGKFGDWNESVYRMQRADDGTWFLALELESDCDYQYRYRTDKGDWYDDPAITGYMQKFDGNYPSAG